MISTECPYLNDPILKLPTDKTITFYYVIYNQKVEKFCGRHKDEMKNSLSEKKV